jgi:23S rRNA pseudoU1915 N3-methylase RlmH
MPQRQNKRLRKERYQRNLEREIEESTNPPSEGQFCVLCKKTGKKIKGLNWDQAVKVWNEQESAIILNDEHVRNGPLQSRDW